VTRERFRDFLVLYAKQVAQGLAAERELMLACRGTPLDKDGKGGVRPIAVGDLIYNIVAKYLLRLYSRPNCLLPYQLGVRSPGGIEPVVQAVERGLEGEVEQEYVVQLDFTNAYNSVSRVDCAKADKKHCLQLFRAAQWAYDKATPVIPAHLDVIVIITNGSLTIDHVAKFFSSLRSSPSLNRSKSPIQSFGDIRQTDIKFLGTAVG
jgi:hypothetical protein